MHLLSLAFTLTFLARLHITSASDDLDYTSSDTTTHIPIPEGFQFDIKMVSAKSVGKYRAPTAVLDVDAYPVAPPELELEQVHVYIRHGERTPVSVRMSEQPASIPEHWIMCNHSRNFRVAMKEFQGSSDAINLDPASLLDAPTKVQSPHGNVKRVVERGNGMAMEGECLLGQLSDLGKETTHNYGLALRRLYIDRLKFLPTTLSRQSDAYFRSTNIPRTIESLQEIIHGLYPAANCSPGVTPELRVRNGRDENLLGNTLACKRLSVLLVNFADAAAAAYNPVLEPLDEKISKYIGGNPVRINGQPRASGILDTVRSAMAHGVKLPPEFEERSVMETIEKAVVNEWFAGYKTEEVRRLGMGRLLGDLVSKMQSRAREADGAAEAGVPRILVHSTHDTALAALTSTLDVFDNRWPAFTASVTFELFRRTSATGDHAHGHGLDSEADAVHAHMNVDAQPPQNPGVLQTVLGAGQHFAFRRRAREHGDYYVRARYQNRSLQLPLCADEGKHLPGAPEFCTLGAFAERVAELVPRDWEAECAVKS